MRFATCDVKAERSYKELGFAVSEATKRSYQTISVILDEQKKESQPLFLIWRLINMYIVIGNQQSRIAIFFSGFIISLLWKVLAAVGSYGLYYF